mgnify:CR=1 FL=1
MCSRVFRCARAHVWQTCIAGLCLASAPLLYPSGASSSIFVPGSWASEGSHQCVDHQWGRNDAALLLLILQELHESTQYSRLTVSVQVSRWGLTHVCILYMHLCACMHLHVYARSQQLPWQSDLSHGQSWPAIVGSLHIVACICICVHTHAHSHLCPWQSDLGHGQSWPTIVGSLLVGNDA